MRVTEVDTRSQPLERYAVVPAPPATSVPLPYPVGGAALGAAIHAAVESTEHALDELEADLSQQAEALQVAIERTSDDCVRAGAELLDAATGGLRALAQLIGRVAPEIGGELGRLLEGAAPELLSALEKAEHTMAAGSDTVGLMLALASPLHWGRRTVEHISELLEAMALGL